MTPDILSPKGQQSLAHEREAANIWHEHNPTWRYVQTEKTLNATVDGLIIDEEAILRVVETKCRLVSLRQFEIQYRSEWLVTADKLQRACEIAKAIRTPLMGWLYLVPDKLLLVKTLTDDLGRIKVGYREEVTKTPATINGGAAERLNAFIDMTGARRLR